MVQGLKQFTGGSIDMFQRQPFGSVSPFQSWPGINPFFQQAAGINPFFQQAAGANPFLQQLVGSNPLLNLYGGINPLQQIAGQISPLQQIAGQISPFHQFAGQPPFSPLLGMNPLISQMTGAQQLGLTPGFGTPTFGAGPLGIPTFGAGPLGVPTAPWGVPTAPWGVQAGPFGHQGIHGGAYGVGPVNPYAAHFGYSGGINPLSVDPTAALMLAQQSNPVSQYFPVRPLIGQNPLEQFQGISAGHIPGPVIDPYAALINAQICSQLGTNPLLQHLVRAQVGSQ
jgi:hypothetical protein